MCLSSTWQLGKLRFGSSELMTSPGFCMHWRVVGTCVPTPADPARPSIAPQEDWPHRIRPSVGSSTGPGLVLTISCPGFSSCGGGTDQAAREGGHYPACGPSALPRGCVRGSCPVSSATPGFGGCTPWLNQPGYIGSKETDIPPPRRMCSSTCTVVWRGPHEIVKWKQQITKQYTIYTNTFVCFLKALHWICMYMFAYA